MTFHPQLKLSWDTSTSDLNKAQDGRGGVCHAAADGYSPFTEGLFLSTTAAAANIDGFKVSGRAANEDGNGWVGCD